MSVLQLLTQQLTGDRIKSLSRSIGIDEATATSAVQAALPVLVSALAKKTKKADGAKALDAALERDHDGSILDNLSDALEKPNLADGAGILGHVFGARKSAVEEGVGQESGLDMGSAAKLLSTLAPVVMGALGREKKSKGMDLAAMADMLNVDYQEQLEANRQKKSKSPLAKVMDLIDTDDDGEITDELSKVTGALGGLFGKKS